ncbi:MAG: hypothetical protein R6T92_00625 [Desulfosalsimonadaceae bacterium]
MSAPEEEKCIELVFGFIHCIGKTVYPAGFAASESEAVRWVEKQKQGENGRVKVPPQDPIHWCPVRHCHMKCQKPWFGYRLC